MGTFSERDRIKFAKNTGDLLYNMLELRKTNVAKVSEITGIEIARLVQILDGSVDANFYEVSHIMEALDYTLQYKDELEEDECVVGCGHCEYCGCDDCEDYI